MNDKVNEILNILQEECAEVIVAISKIQRFGIDNSYKDGGTQREHLVQELGDVSLLIELLVAHNIVDPSELHQAKINKSIKLTKWSKIYD